MAVRRTSERGMESWRGEERWREKRRAVKTLQINKFTSFVLHNGAERGAELGEAQ